MHDERTLSLSEELAAKRDAGYDKMLEKFKLPSRVYVRLVLLDSAENEHVFETQARIHLRFPLNF